MAKAAAAPVARTGPAGRAQQWDDEEGGSGEIAPFSAFGRRWLCRRRHFLNADEKGKWNVAQPRTGARALRTPSRARRATRRQTPAPTPAWPRAASLARPQAQSKVTVAYLCVHVRIIPQKGEKMMGKIVKVRFGGGLERSQARNMNVQTSMTLSQPFEVKSLRNARAAAKLTRGRTFFWSFIFHIFSFRRLHQTDYCECSINPLASQDPLA
jgi:hypothetical protein